MTPRRAAAIKKSKYFESDSESDGNQSGSDFQDAEENGVDVEEEEEIPTEDDDVSQEEEPTSKKGKRGRASTMKTTPVKRRKSQPQAKGRAKKEESEDEDEDEEGGEITSVNTFTPAPREQHKKGQIGKPTIEFMTKLLDPKYNDREWFQLNERVWKWVKQGKSTSPKANVVSMDTNKIYCL